MSKLIYVDRLKKDILALQDCYNGFSDTYDKACIIGVIEEQPTIEPQRWIPCSERLPEYGIEVVTVDKDGEYEINHIIDEEDGEWFWEKAIAWMPLPEPYTEGEQ